MEFMMSEQKTLREELRGEWARLGVPESDFAEHENATEFLAWAGLLTWQSTEDAAAIVKHEVDKRRANA